jgi:FKBP-type peptidyl-prolyl cis-trans isomerase
MVVLVAGFGCAKEEKVELESVSQKASYAIGLQVARSLETFPTEFDRNAFVTALDDTLAGKEPRLSQQEISAVFGELQAAAQQKAEAANKERAERGQAFLAENAKKEGVKVTESGLQYMVLNSGKGKKPVAKDTVEVHYRGTTIDGKEFDSSYSRGTPATFGVTQVIPGWIEALQLMTVGSRYRLFVPSHLAYGARGAGPDIGPNETLIFEVELIGIK